MGAASLPPPTQPIDDFKHLAQLVWRELQRGTEHAKIMRLEQYLRHCYETGMTHGQQTGIAAGGPETLKVPDQAPIVAPLSGEGLVAPLLVGDSIVAPPPIPAGQGASDECSQLLGVGVPGENVVGVHDEGPPSAPSPPVPPAQPASPFPFLKRSAT